MTESLYLYPATLELQPNLSEVLEDKLVDRNLMHYASSLLEKGLQDADELNMALCKALTALDSAQVPAYMHFKKVFVSRGHDIVTDWLVSTLALRLIMLNANVTNPVVAHLQIEVLSNNHHNEQQQ
ncbi:MAG TPA: hypothetical protein VFZ42_04680 [Chitinophagaceae bacterium]